LDIFAHAFIALTFITVTSISHATMTTMLAAPARASFVL
jgi:hypothetical protein